MEINYLVVSGRGDSPSVHLLEPTAERNLIMNHKWDITIPTDEIYMRNGEGLDFGERGVRKFFYLLLNSASVPLSTGQMGSEAGA